MAFKNLEQRFQEKVNALYAGAKYKFNDGRPSLGASDDPLIVRKPGDGYFGGASRALGRFLPVSSAKQDVKRLTLFTMSVRGITFLLKQQLLQTGNTFEQTRLINPLFVLGAAAAPGLGNIVRVRRHLRPIGSLVGKTDTGYANVRKLGQLQQSTYDSLTKVAGGGIGAFLKKLAGPLTSTLSAFTAKKNIGEKFGYGETGWAKSRPELGENRYVVAKFNKDGFMFRHGGFVAKASTYGARFKAASPSVSEVTEKNGIEYTAYYQKIAETDGKAPGNSDYTSGGGIVPDLNKNDPLVRTTKLSDVAGKNDLLHAPRSEKILSLIKTQLDTQQSGYFTTVGQTPYLKYFTGGQGSITGLPQKEKNGEILSRNAKYEANNKLGRISYLKDESNHPVAGNPNTNIREAYNNLIQIDPSAPQSAQNGFEDPIIVSFAMGKDAHVQFRAFIKDLQQVASPQYKDYQYIGRIEKFVSYISVQREVSFKLGVIAFSQDELDIVWKRINYLTGMVFPYGINKGILQPNIIRMTIGNVYVNQPAYITALTTNFNEPSESWDIDKQVPIGATMDIRCTLIEKRTALADTPLYGITEGVSGFKTSLSPPTPPISATDFADEFGLRAMSVGQDRRLF